mgnify:CR=1 FL=1
MIEPEHPKLSLSRQCALVGISRSAFYAPSKGESPLNLSLMRVIDAQFLETPWYGSRQMARHLRRQGHVVGRKRVRRLMAKMGLSAVYQKPRTTVPHPEHRTWPYLLRNVVIDRPDQVWCADITYIPMQRGFLDLVAIMDWASRRVLSWRLSNTMDADFCIEALEEAMARHGRPEMFNTAHCSRFTGPRFTEVLLEADVKISMDGKGRWRSSRTDHDPRRALGIPLPSRGTGRAQWVTPRDGTLQRTVRSRRLDWSVSRGLWQAMVMEVAMRTLILAIVAAAWLAPSGGSNFHAESSRSCPQGSRK